MLLLLAALASAAPATLHVYVPPLAGTVYDVAADGASGQCRVSPSHLVCPAKSTVTFRWGPGGPFQLTGATTLEPGEAGVAWVLAAEGPNAPLRASLTDDKATADTVRQAFVWFGGHEPPIPSPGMLTDLQRLAKHPDPEVRIQVATALRPWFSKTTTGPLPAQAPPPIPVSVVYELAADPDPRVRRRVAQIYRDLRPGLLDEQGAAAFDRLLHDADKRVRRAAVAAVTDTVQADLMPAEEAWQRSLEALTSGGSPSRAAAATLSRLAEESDPTDVIDPLAAMPTVLELQPERAWRYWWSWREHIPFNPAWASVLLRETYILRKDLLLHWAAEDPEAFARVLQGWEPDPPHTERWERARVWLSDTDAMSIRTAMDLGEKPVEEPEEADGGDGAEGSDGADEQP